MHHDRPWRRPGAAAYARRRIRALFRPPVTVVEAPAELRKDHDVPVVLSDGTTLRVNLYRLAGPGPFPVILSAHPYGKDALPRRRGRGWRLNFQFHIMNQPEPYRISSETGWEAADPLRWVAAGFAVINADLRGAGTSEGVGPLLSDQEAHDVAEIIEWAGTQPWSNGRVGMLGVSYLAISQYRAAALHPPHLAAICPWEGFTDLYRDFMTPGGIRERGFSVIWQTLSRRVARISTDFAAGRRAHPLRDEWWEAITPDLERIEVPMLVCASFSDHELHSQGAWRLFELASSTERTAYTHRGPKWAVFYGDDAFQAQRSFFDRHLRGPRSTADESARSPALPPALPPVRLEVRESRTTIAEVRAEQEWPLARTVWTERYLSPGGLVDAVPASGERTFALRRGSASFELPIELDVEFTGPMSLRLWLALEGADDAHLFVGVEKWRGREYVPFEGSYGYGRDRIAGGRLAVSLRALSAASRPHEPEHDYLQRRPLTPGEVVPVELALGASSTLFRAGDTLRLIVAGRSLEPGNPLFGHFPARYRPSRGGRCRLLWGPEHPAALTLPVIPRGS
ncbi:MAG: CocE/NonD family hydrolase [Acidobacteria bacterium]|nr:CocE/NonD family hydrolase [Acidobacteriota bacterium]